MEIKKLREELEIKKDEREEMIERIKVQQIELEHLKQEKGEKIIEFTGSRYLVNVRTDGIEFYDDEKKRGLSGIFTIYCNRSFIREDSEVKIELNYYTTTTSVENTDELIRLQELGKIAKFLQNSEFVELVKAVTKEVWDFERKKLESTYSINSEINDLERQIETSIAEQRMAVGEIVTIHTERSVDLNGGYRARSGDTLKVLKVTPKKVRVLFDSKGWNGEYEVLLSHDDFLYYVKKENDVLKEAEKI